MGPRKGKLTLVPSFFASWLTIELAPFWIVFTVIWSGLLVAGGALDKTAGAVGLALATLAVLGLDRDRAACAAHEWS